MDASSSTIARLAEFHLRRCRARLKQARHGAEYDKAYLQSTIETWNSILLKGCKWASLTEGERLEVSDALTAEMEEEVDTSDR